MPIMPTFSGFAGTPNLGANYVAGAGLALREREMQQQASDAQAAIAMKQQQLAQQSQQAQMEIELKKQQLEQQHLINQQELNIKQQYQQQMVDLNNRKLGQVAEKVNLQTSQAAQKFAAQQRSRTRINAGEDPNKVFMEEGPQMGLNGPALASFAGNSTSKASIPAEFEPVAGDPTGKWRRARIGKESWQYILPERTTREDMGRENLDFKIEQEQNRIALNQLKSIDTQLENGKIFERGYEIAKDKKAVIPEAQLKRHEEYLKLREKRDQIQASLEKSGGASAPSSEQNELARKSEALKSDEVVHAVKDPKKFDGHKFAVFNKDGKFIRYAD